MIDPEQVPGRGWEVYDGREVHVIPKQGSDGITHDLDMDCVCGPAIEFHERPLVTHHSLDGREQGEGR